MRQVEFRDNIGPILGFRRGRERFIPINVSIRHERIATTLKTPFFMAADCLQILTCWLQGRAKSGLTSKCSDMVSSLFAKELDILPELPYSVNRYEHGERCHEYDR